MNLYKKIVAGSAALLLSGFANVSMAGSVSIAPDPALGNLGDSVFVDLVWDGTGADVDYLAGWDLDVSFDDSILAFVDAAFDPDDALLLDVSGFGPTASGVGVNAFSLSLSFSPELVAAQDALGNVFTMASLEFTAIGVGDTDLILSENAFTDPNGSSLDDVMLINGQACIDPAGTTPGCGGDTPMPEPGILSLFGLSLLSLALVRRRSRL